MERKELEQAGNDNSLELSFKKLSNDDKVSFILECDVEKNEYIRSFFENIVRSTVSSSDHWYFANVIELASRLKVKSSELFDR